MNPTNDPGSDHPPAGARSPGEAGAPCDDPRVIRALEEYQAELEAGYRPDREGFQRRYPEIAEALAGCLAGLEFVQVAAPQLCPPEAVPDPSTVLVPEGPLGDYRLVREVGRGGMGVVYEAVQISLGRRVALKVLPFAAALDPRQLQRFKNEAQAAAQLHHAHIVPVHGVGCERGVHFYAMHFIEGSTLAALIAGLRDNDEGRSSNDKRMPNPQAPTEETLVGLRHSTLEILSSFKLPNASFFRTVAQLGIQAAEALDYAHRQGIIHRDIKPANLLLESRAGGVNPLVLWIADFGLAKLQGQGSLTLSGDVVGTLRYMSPEQALAKYAQVDERTDLYSLGATLYELLTLEPAFPGQDREELLRQIAFEEPRPLRRLNAAIPVELETIILKAMAKSPEERYASAQELADDLRRFLDDRPIQARRPSLRQRAVKWARRHKTVVRAALVVLLLAVMALVVSTVFIWRANEDLNRANADLTQALERERQNAYHQRIALADRELSVNNLNRAEELLDLCPPELRGWEWHYLRRLGRGKDRIPLRHDAAILSVAISPSGERLASVDQHGFLKLWDLPSGQCLHSIPAYPGQQARCVAFSPDGQRLASTCWDGTVSVWEAESCRPLHSWKAHASADRVAFSPDGRRLVSGGRDEQNNAEVRIWDATTYEQILAIEGLKQRLVRVLALSPDGQRLATSLAADPEVTVWDAQTGRELLTFRGHTGFGVNCVAFSPDGRWIASGSAMANQQGNGVVKIWDSQTGLERLTLGGHLKGVHCLAFSPNGGRLATGGADQNVKIWDLATGQEALTLREHRNNVWSVEFSRDGHCLVSASVDRTVRVWDGRPWQKGEPGQEWLTLGGHTNGVDNVAFHPTEQRLASGDADGVIKLWDLSPRHAGGVPPPSRTLRAYARVLAFSPDGKWLATAARQYDHVKLWDMASVQEVRSLKGRTQQFTCVAFSPDGKHVAAAGLGKGTVDLWDMATGRRLRSLSGDNWGILSVAFCPPDGCYLASGGADGTLRVWDTTTGQEIIQPQPPHHDAVGGVAFSRDGKYLASGSYDRTVRVWEKGEGGASWKPVHVLFDPTGGIMCVAFSPDGRLLAWGGTDSTVKLADLEASRVQGVQPPIVTLHGHTSWVQGIAFSPDGHHLASASRDGTVKIWATPATLRGGANAAPNR